MRSKSSAELKDCGERRVGEWVEGTLEELHGGVRQRARRGERQMQHLVYLIGNPIHLTLLQGWLRS